MGGVHAVHLVVVGGERVAGVGQPILGQRECELRLGRKRGKRELGDRHHDCECGRDRNVGQRVGECDRELGGVVDRNREREQRGQAVGQAALRGGREREEGVQVEQNCSISAMDNMFWAGVTVGSPSHVCIRGVCCSGSWARTRSRAPVRGRGARAPSLGGGASSHGRASTG